MTGPTPDPLSPAEVEALLHPDPRTRAADLLVLRDALQRMAEALERLSVAVHELGAHGPALLPPGDRAVELPLHPGVADVRRDLSAADQPADGHPADPDERRRDGC